MAIADQAALITETKLLTGGSFDKISDPGWVRVATQTELELGWPYAVTDSNKEYWMVERCRRHSMYLLMVEAANKFQYKKIFLQHKFHNYIQLIKQMDEDFYKAVEDDPHNIFEDIGASFSDFASYIGNGYITDNLGRDCSYLNDRVVHN